MNSLLVTLCVGTIVVLSFVLLLDWFCVRFLFKDDDAEVKPPSKLAHPQARGRGREI